MELQPLGNRVDLNVSRREERGHDLLPGAEDTSCPFVSPYRVSRLVCLVPPADAVLTPFRAQMPGNHTYL